MKCKGIRALFSEYYDGELNEEVGFLIKEHLSQCKKCKDEYMNFKKIIKVLKKLKPLEIPRNYLKNIIK